VIAGTDRRAESALTNAAGTWGVSEEAARLHADALIWDMTVPWGEWPGSDSSGKPAALEMMAASGYDLAALTVGGDNVDILETVKLIARERAFLAAHADRYTLAGTADEVVAAKREGRLALVFQFQGTNSLGRDVNMIEPYYQLGVRIALMAYNQKNAVGDGCHERTDGGLSRFGIEVVREMQRVGMMVDVTHTGYRTSMDVFEVAEGPVVFSHSNPRALFDHERNIRDDQIKACARSGGVIGVNGIGIFMGGDNDVSPDQLLRQIDYLGDLVGPEHVGIGLDWVYDQPSLLRAAKASKSRYPEKGGYDGDIAFASPDRLPRLTEAMLRRGYSEAVIRGILGENWLRVARSVWR
jgi:membrane dipeptidase